MSGKMKKWKVLTAAVVLAVGFWGAPQGAEAATAVSGTSANTGTTTATASGTNATAVGEGAKATANGTVAVGVNAQVLGSGSSSNNGSIAIGYGANVSAHSSIAIGGQYSTNADALAASVKSTQSVAIGTGSSVGENAGLAVALGWYSTANGIWSTALGAQSRASANSATAVGRNAVAGAERTTSFGSDSEASVEGATALGYRSMGLRQSAIAIGMHAQAGAPDSVEDGQGIGSIAIGSIVDEKEYTTETTWHYKTIARQALTFADYAIALGTASYVKANATKAVAIGYGSYASVANAVALGANSLADTENTISVGSSNTTSGFTRKIVNVSNGSANTDAAAYGQLVNAQAVTKTSEDDSATATTYTPYEADSNGLVTVKTNDGGTAFTFKVGTSSTDSGLVIGDETNGWLDISWNGAADSTSVTRGTNSTAYGYKANASDQKATAIGFNSQASAVGAIAIGNATASGFWSVAIGDGAQATSSEEEPEGASIAIGSDSKASEDYATAIGSSAEATGLRAYAIGNKAKASEVDAMAIGNFAVAEGEESIAFGYSADALTYGSIAFGRDSEASGGIVASAFGYGSKATDQKATAIGFNSQASAVGAIAIGNATASGFWSVAIGDGAQATSSEEEPEGAIAIGSDSKASEDYATAIGSSAEATGLRAYAIGNKAAASGIDSMSLGNFAVAEGEESIAIGYSADALTFGSIAFGRDSEASGGIVASAFGYGSKATQQAALALGAFSQATGLASVAIGGNSQASDTLATAVGYENHATGQASSILGSNSTAQGTAAVAIGYQSVANTGMTEEDGDTVKYVSFGHKDGDEYIYTNPTTSEIVKGNYSGNSYSRLTNVAKGTAANEAATWDQLVNEQAIKDASGNITGYKPYEFAADGTVTVNNNAGGTAFVLKLTNNTIDGKEETGTGYVTNQAMYTELRPTSGTYVNSSNTTAANLVALDNKIGKITGDTTIVQQANSVSTNLVALENAIKDNKSSTDTAIDSVTLENKTYTFNKNNAEQNITYQNNGGTAFTIKIEGLGEGGSGGTTYEEGNGIAIDTTSTKPTISAKVADKGGLSVDTNGLAIKTAEKGGLSVDENGLAVKVAEKGALSVDGNGLSVKVAENGGLTADGNGLSVQKDGKVASGNTGIVTGGTVYNSMVTNGSYDSSTGRLTFTNGKGDTSFSVAINGSGVIYKGDDKTIAISDNNEFSVKYDSTDLTVNDNGIAVKKDGKVESGNTGLVTGGTVYDAMKSMDNQVTQLSDDIQKVGAGAAALAALHPEGYDPNDKWSFAVGYGHYKGANAGALGAFFKPNADTTVSVAGTVGNGDSMVNAGFSFRLGKRGKKMSTYRSSMDLVERIDALEAAMSREIQRNNIQDSRLDAHDSRFEAQDQKIAQLQADIARMQQQLAILLSDTGVAII